MIICNIFRIVYLLKRLNRYTASAFCRSELAIFKVINIKNYEYNEAFFLLRSLPILLLSLSCGFEADWNNKTLVLSVVPVKLETFSGLTFSKIQLDR